MTGLQTACFVHEIFIEKYKTFLCNFLTVSIFASLTELVSMNAIRFPHFCHCVPSGTPEKSTTCALGRHHLFQAWFDQWHAKETDQSEASVSAPSCSYVPSSLCVLSLLRRIPKTPKSIIQRQYAIDYLFSAGAGLGFLLSWKSSITIVFSKAQVKTSLVLLFSGIIIVEIFHHFILRKY